MIEECPPTSDKNKCLSDSEKIDIVIALTVHSFNLKVLLNNPRYAPDSDILTFSISQMVAVIRYLMEEFNITEERLMESLQKSHEEERIKVIAATEDDDSRMYG